MISWILAIEFCDPGAPDGVEASVLAADEELDLLPEVVILPSAGELRERRGKRHAEHRDDTDAERDSRCGDRRTRGGSLGSGC